MPRGPSPIYVVTGFLGSGKTTLVRRILERILAQGVRPGVVMNEFGESDVDGTLVREGEEARERLELRSVLAGCVCCDAGDRFAEQLLDLLEDVDGAPVVIETTGLAEPGQVANAVDLALAGAEHLGRLARLVVVVDASRLRETDRSWDAGRHHLRRADTIVLNKIDRATASDIAEASRRADRDAPGAQLFHAMYADVPIAKLLRPARRRRVLAVRNAEIDSAAGFRSVTCGLRGLLDAEALGRALARHARTLHRAKGVVRTAPDGAWETVQWTPGSLERTPWTGAAPEGEPRLVLIGRRTPWERALRRVAKCVVPLPRPLSASRRPGASARRRP